MRIKCLAQEHNNCNTMFLVRAQSQMARSRVEYTNHEANTPRKLIVIAILLDNSVEGGKVQ